MLDPGTQANQFWLLGFGGDRHRGYSPSLRACGLRSPPPDCRWMGASAQGPQHRSVDDQCTAGRCLSGWTPKKNLSLVACVFEPWKCACNPRDPGETRHQMARICPCHAGFEYERYELASSHSMNRMRPATVFAGFVQVVGVLTCAMALSQCSPTLYENIGGAGPNFKAIAGGFTGPPSWRMT